MTQKCTQTDKKGFSLSMTVNNSRDGMLPQKSIGERVLNSQKKKKEKANKILNITNS